VGLVVLPTAVGVDVAAEAFDKIFNVDISINNGICPLTAGNWQLAIGGTARPRCARSGEQVNRRAGETETATAGPPLRDK